MRTPGRRRTQDSALRRIVLRQLISIGRKNAVAQGTQPNAPRTSPDRLLTTAAPWATHPRNYEGSLIQSTHALVRNFACGGFRCPNPGQSGPVEGQNLLLSTEFTAFHRVLCTRPCRQLSEEDLSRSASRLTLKNGPKSRYCIRTPVENWIRFVPTDGGGGQQLAHQPGKHSEDSVLRGFRPQRIPS